ncbi:MAG: eukaryotic-like serine/threonine-protein kinase, partial [Solirubrobacteraceae bacterium]|nr:eukaryotic-like serine/threonine-protein kinase [Solirubrobacteraceae bacterium]
AVDAVLARGLAKDPAHRPPTAAAFVAELEHALNGAAAPATEEPTRPMAAEAPRPAVPPPPAPPPRTAKAPPPTDPPPPRVAAPPRVPPSPPPRRRPSRGRGLATAAVFAVAAVAALVVALGSGSDKPAGERGSSSAKASSGQSGAKASTSKPAATTPPAASTGAGATSAAAGPAAIDARGFALIQQGQYAAAVPLELQAVDAYRARGDRSSTNYAYALYNLGTALNRAGRPAEAIPYLQERLSFSRDRPGVVRQELNAAQEAAGVAANGGGGKKPKKADSGGGRGDEG